MTEKKTTTESDTQHLFENNFAYITEDGKILLKGNNLFEERTLGSVDPDSAEEKIKELEDAFEKLSEKVEGFFEGSSKLTDANELESSFNKLIDEILTSVAVGDFESLVSSAKAKFSERTSSKEVTEEPEETTEPEPAEEATADKSAEDKEVKTEEETSDIEPEKTEVKGEVDEEEKPEEETAKEPVKEEQQEEDAAEEVEETAEDYYKKLAEKAETLSELSDWAYATMEFENIDLKWSEGPEAEGADLKPYRQKIDSLREALDEKKKAHYEEQKRIREENLEKKKEVLKQLKQIIDEEKWTHTRDVARLKGRWEQIKPIPASEQEKLESSFNGLLSTFEEHKVDRLVKQKQQEEDNLTGKLVILEKMEEFLNSVDENSDWKELDDKLSDYTRQFRKIGRIPVEKNQETWDRFHRAQDNFHSMRFKYDAKYRKDIEKFLSKKKQLIDEAEALIDSEDIAKASRKVNKLHRRWKKIGNLPQKDENEMWDRFKAATDAFNDKKSENIDQLREQEEENYNKKLRIIDKANELKESEEWEQTHKEFQKLMDQWKAIGPVPKRKSGKIWKKFKDAMDHFYDRRRDFFKEVKEERKDNLKEKEAVLDQLKELKTHENPIKAVDLAKPLQEEFKKAGYVPIKHKNRMWKEYRETCDIIYERFRASKSAAQIVGKENVENFTPDDIADIKKKQDQADKLRKEINKLSGELIQMKESLSYFKPSSSGSSLLDDVKSRIDNAEQDINKKEEKLQKLEIEIDKIKRDA
ncbi:MAG: DUF349 domain-containing protein [Balneolaceae bacterium]|nr:DUF349 domain-containing protein [Balneolaceae bacterium]